MLFPVLELIPLFWVRFTQVCQKIHYHQTIVTITTTVGIAVFAIIVFAAAIITALALSILITTFIHITITKDFTID